MGKKQRRSIAAALASVPEGESRVILATGSYIGEGFDDARLDTLFLAMPISWKGTLQQYVCRLHRLHDSKRFVQVFDYVNRNVLMLSRMFERRLKGYGAIGYTIRARADSSPCGSGKRIGWCRAVARRGVYLGALLHPTDPEKIIVPNRATERADDAKGAIGEIAECIIELMSAVASENVVDLEKLYLLQNYARHPLVLHRGDGPYMWDVDGKRYLDFIAGIGVNALGQNHPRIVEVIREQAARLIHTSNLFYNEYQGPLAKRIAQVSGLNRTFFTNSGTESTEGSLKMMKAHGHDIHPDKYQIVSLRNSFHGRTLGAISITGQPKYRADFEPLLPGVVFVEPNDIESLESAVGERTAGICIEWIQGEGGVVPIDPAFCKRARELADRYDALLCFDEIQCGVGRTGKYFGYQLIDPPVMPDIMTAAKPIACGIPLGIITANERAAKSIRPGMHGSTFGGNALAARVSLEFFDILEGLLPSIARVGEYFRERLRQMARRFDFIKEVRGYGLMIGADLSIPGKDIVNRAMAEGLLLNCTHDTVLRFLPPYIITEQHVDEAVAILDRVMRTV
jgi:predicted acetylornithine/succinylornithine family transaminase